MMDGTMVAQTSTKGRRLNLQLLSGRMSVCRLAPEAAIPAWATKGNGFVAITRTSDELSIVCPGRAAPKDTKCETGWRTFKIEGPLDFSLTGILVSVAGPLADSGVSIFAVSTYDTDYILVKEENLERAVSVLKAAGHTVRRR